MSVKIAGLMTMKIDTPASTVPRIAPGPCLLHLHPTLFCSQRSTWKPFTKTTYNADLNQY